MKLLHRPTTTVAIAMGALTVGTGVAGADAGASLAEVRAATARYHHPSVAAAEGFVDVDGECVADPTAGGMGIHYGRFDRLDEHLDAGQPEILLYEPAEGRNRLVGVEYVVLAPVDQPPTLFGQPFEQGPEVADGTAIWALHVWVWRHNPAGTFAAFNPNVSCPTGLSGPHSQ
jgi:hypothetical protein